MKKDFSGVKNKPEVINLCFICDDNYAMPTAVAITSLKLHRDTKILYEIYIIQNGLSSVNEKRLLSLATTNFHITFIDGEKYANYSEVDGIRSAKHVSTSALYKFNLPDIFPTLDRILYLDGDLLIRDSLASLYFMELGDNYAAACPDMGAEFFIKPYNLRLNTDLEYYFNSGVLLLNLKQLRIDDLTKKLFDYRLNGKNDFMDQDAFNVCFQGKVAWIDFMYNFTITSYEKFDSETICYYYNLPSMTKNEMYSAAKIVHLCSMRKPWTYSDAFGSEEWLGYYIKSPFLENKLDRKKMDVINKEFYSHKDSDFIVNAIPSEKVEEPLISVIIPVYNSEQFLKSCVESLMLQTFTNAEFIFVDDGSTDNSVSMLKKYQQLDSRIVIETQENQYAAVARNNGIKIAKGKYITFLDSDDIFDKDALKSFYHTAIRTNADIVISGANYFSDDVSDSKPAGWCLRKEFLPFKNVFSPLDASNNLFLISAGAPWGKFYKAELIKDNNINFPPLPRAEDFSFVYTCFVLAKKMTIVNSPLVYYRLLENSNSLEGAKDKYPLASIEGHKELFNRLNNLGVYETYRNCFENNFIHSISNQLRTFKNDESKKLLKEAIVDFNSEHLKIDFSNPERFVYKKETVDILFIISPRLCSEKKKFFIKEIDKKDSKNENKKTQTTPDTENKDIMNEIHALKKKLSEADVKYIKLENKYNSLKKSKTYRLGRFITWLPRKILKRK